MLRQLEHTRSSGDAPADAKKHDDDDDDYDGASIDDSDLLETPFRQNSRRRLAATLAMTYTAAANGVIYDADVNDASHLVDSVAQVTSLNRDSLSEGNPTVTVESTVTVQPTESKDALAALASCLLYTSPSPRDS